MYMQMYIIYQIIWSYEIRAHVFMAIPHPSHRLRPHDATGGWRKVGRGLKLGAGFPVEDQEA